MIYIDRSVQSLPSILDPSTSAQTKQEVEEAKIYFHNPEVKRGQTRFSFRVSLSREVKIALRKLFNDKCAYCEANLDRVQPRQKTAINGEIEHYRPHSSVLEAPNHPGYWWLASEWHNLLIACPQCQRGSGGAGGKGNRFPLLNEENRIYDPSHNLSLEQALLLNPCTDRPENHLVFAENGQVFSETEKGKTSILVLDLNRKDLVSARLTNIMKIKDFGNDLEQKIGLSKSKSLSQSEMLQNDNEINEILQQVEELTHPSSEFTGLNRQFVKSILERSGAMSSQQTSSIVAQSKTISKKRQSSAKKAYQSYTKDISNIALGSQEENKQSYLLLNHYIDKIELKNIKTFSNQIFDFTSSQSENAPWMMLLGENGTGKSTVLKSISLNMSDENYFISLIRKGLVDPNKFIRYGCKVASIKVWFNGLENPRVLELRKNEYTFTSPTGEKSTISAFDLKAKKSTFWTARTFLLGYGATRLLPRGNKSEEAAIDGDYVRADNLFNPFVPLSNAEKWLLSLDPTHFRRAALILKDLLNMGKDENLIRSSKSISVNINGSQMPFDELSDGYQSIVALTADILQMVMKEWKNPDEARGIVVLDEVGAHLHPQWKMRVVGSLRKALPHMQFIVSSHQPLCLRGLGAGEVNIIKRGENKKVEVLTDLPNPKELRISQILTSVFGLSSTLDPELEAEYKRYYELRAKHELTDYEQEEVNLLQEQLRPDMMMGDTLLDTQTYQVVKEQYKQFKEKEKQSDLDKLSEDTLSAVKSLWTK